jgi:hypothetical protein
LSSEISFSCGFWWGFPLLSSRSLTGNILPWFCNLFLCLATTLHFYLFKLLLFTWMSQSVAMGLNNCKGKWVWLINTYIYDFPFIQTRHSYLLNNSRYIE